MNHRLRNRGTFVSSNFAAWVVLYRSYRSGRQVQKSWFLHRILVAAAQRTLNGWWRSCSSLRRSRTPVARVLREFPGESTHRHGRRYVRTTHRRVSNFGFSGDRFHASTNPAEHRWREYCRSSPASRRIGKGDGTFEARIVACPTRFRCHLERRSKWK